MPSTNTYETSSASTPSTPQNEIVLSRPRGVYTGEYRSKRSRSRDGNKGSATGGYASEYHRQSLSRAVILISGITDTKAETPKDLTLQYWFPILSPLASSSGPMEGFCMEFARLATELQNGWD